MRNKAFQCAYSLVRLLLVQSLLLPSLATVSAQIIQSATASASYPDVSQTSAPRLRVAYTGALYGYFRDDSGYFRSGFVRSFIDAHSGGGTDGKPILLGMGDNFGPEFGASIQPIRPLSGGCDLNVDSGNGKQPPRFPQALYKDDLRIGPRVDCDNVGDFLLQAGYRALVPGREDFMYGSGWLRTIAEEMRASRDAAKPSQRSANADHSLTMLAANVRLKLSVASDSSGARSEKLKFFCPLLFSANNQLTYAAPSARERAGNADALATCSQQTSGSPPELLDVLERMTLVLQKPELAEYLDIKAGGSPDGKQPVISEADAGFVRQFRNQLISNQLDELRLMVWGLQGAQPLLKWIDEVKKKFADSGTLPISPDEVDGLATSLAALQRGETGNAGTTLLPVSEANYKEIQPFAESLMKVLQTARTPLGQKAAVNDTKWPSFLVEGSARGAGVNAVLRAIAREQENRGYTVASTGAGAQQGQGSGQNQASEEALIIGVVGETDLDDVSLTDRRFCFHAGPGSGSGSGGLRMDYCDAPSAGTSQQRIEADLNVINPVRTVVALMRAAQLTHPRIRSVIVMAQMPHTEAEELGTAVQEFLCQELCVRNNGKETIPEGLVSPIATILSEAQPYQNTGDMQQAVYQDFVAPPVLTPQRAYALFAADKLTWAGPASEATVFRCLGRGPGVADHPCAFNREMGRNPYYTVRNRESTSNWNLTNPASSITPATAADDPQPYVWDSMLLAREILQIPESGSQQQLGPYAGIRLARFMNGKTPKTVSVGDLLVDGKCVAHSGSTYSAPSVPNVDEEQSCDIAVMHLLLQMLGRGARQPNVGGEFLNPSGELSDVAMLEGRDIWFGALPPGYDSPEKFCSDWENQYQGPAKQAAFTGCELRISLDIVLWKGDYATRTQARGSDLAQMMDQARKVSAGEQDLSSNDLTGQWLSTFGLEESAQTNLTTVAPNPETFWVPEASNCADNDNAPPQAKSGSGGQSPGAQGGNQATYCVEGKTIQADASYWLITSNHLVQDTLLYTNLSGLPKQYRSETRCYLTEKIYQAFQVGTQRSVDRCFRGHAPASEAPQEVSGDDRQNPEEDAQEEAMAAPPSAPQAKNGSAQPGSQSSGPIATLGSATSGGSGYESNQQLEGDVVGMENAQQNVPLLHLDFAKVVAGFDTREAVGGDSYVASGFQGVTDSRASAPSMRELDLEQQMRGYFRFRITPHGLQREIRFGIQDDTDFDRSVQGNLIGKAENPAFPLDSFTGGAFLETRILGAGEAHFVSGGLRYIPVASIKPAQFSFVFAPGQYQRQIVGNYLYFPFSSTADGAGPKNNSDLTVLPEPAYAWIEKAGIRETATTPDQHKRVEWDSGSYWEFGMQLLNQRQVLSALTINTPDATKGPKSLRCDATGSLTFANCAKGITIDGESTISNVTYANPTQYGFYWDVNLQKQLTSTRNQMQKVSLIVSSKGDRLVASHIPLSTETRFDAPLSTAVSFQLLPNLSVAPAYNGFWYSNQVLDGHLFVNEGLITLRWYYNRDSLVPFRRLFRFNGPASDDQTKSMHMSKGGGSGQ